MKNLSLNEFRGLCDELNFPSRIEKDTILLPILDNDKSDRFIVVAFTVLEGMIRIHAYFPECGKELGREKTLEFCNEWNRVKAYPRVCLDSDGICVVGTFLMDEDVSAEYIKKNVIQLSLICVCDFHVALGKQLKGQNPFEDEDN